MNPSLELLAKAKFCIGETVQFGIKSGTDTGIVDELIITPDCLIYGVVWSNKSHQRHYDFELKKMGK